MAEAPTLPKVREAATPVLATLQAAREQLDAADSPEAVQDVRSRLRVMREVCAAAMRDPACKPEDVVEAKRACEQLSLEASVKLGTMVPADPAPGRPEKPTASVGFGTVADVAKRCGVPASTLRDYRALAAAFRERADAFMSIAKEAIDKGAAAPVGKLIALVKPDKKGPPAAPPPSPPPAPPSPPPRPTGVPNPAATAADAAERRKAEHEERERLRREKAENDIKKARQRFEEPEDIPACGAGLKAFAKHLQDALDEWEKIVPHPLPEQVLTNGTKLPAARDVTFGEIAEALDTVRSLIVHANEAARQDAEGVGQLRAARDRARARKAGA